MAWLSGLDGRVARSGVIILPPIGYPYWSAHRTLRTLAEGLAAKGHLALRLDYDGLGASAGGQWESKRLARWRASAEIAAAELARLGCAELTLIGVRLGATIALLDGAALGATKVVAWAPVASGRRFVKETRLLSAPVPEDFLPDNVEEAIVAAGTVFTASTLKEIGELDLTSSPPAPVPRTMLVDRAPLDALARRLVGRGSPVGAAASGGGESALETPTEYATVPEAIVHGILDWMTNEALANGDDPSGPASTG